MGILPLFILLIIILLKIFARFNCKNEYFCVKIKTDEIAINTSLLANTNENSDTYAPKNQIIFTYE